MDFPGYFPAHFSSQNMALFPHLAIMTRRFHIAGFSGGFPRFLSSWIDAPATRKSATGGSDCRPGKIRYRKQKWLTQKT
jgi:hypothetical protein